MPLDDADKKAIGEMISAALQSDATSTLVAGQVGEALKGLKLDEKVTKAVADAVAAASNSAEEEGDDKDKKKSKADSALERRLAKVQEDLDNERTAREQAEAARKTDALHNAARAELAKAGVPAERIPHAMAYLQVQGLLDFAEGDAPGFKGKDRYGSETVLPMSEGVSAWAKTDDGKAYLPPSGAQGDGQGNGGAGSGRRDASAPRNEDGSLNTGALANRLAAKLPSLV